MSDQKAKTGETGKSHNPEESKEPSGDLFDSLKKAVSKYARLIQAFLEKNKRITWYYEEKHCPEYSLEAAIKWFKENRPAEKTDSVGIYRVAPDGSEVITLYHFFLGVEGPILDGTRPNLVVKTSALDTLLKAHFEQKDLVILK